MHFTFFGRASRKCRARVENLAAPQLGVHIWAKKFPNMGEQGYGPNEKGNVKSLKISGHPKVFDKVFRPPVFSVRFSVRSSGNYQQGSNTDCTKLYNRVQTIFVCIKIMRKSCLMHKSCMYKLCTKLYTKNCFFVAFIVRVYKK